MAAVFNALNEDCKAKFQHLACSLTSFVHGSGEGDRQKLNSIFDELNALDFRSPLVGNSDVSQILRTNFWGFNNRMCFVTCRIEVEMLPLLGIL